MRPHPLQIAFTQGAELHASGCELCLLRILGLALSVPHALLDRYRLFCGYRHWGEPVSTAKENDPGGLDLCAAQLTRVVQVL